VITGAAFCPHPPLLVPAVAAGAADELDDLRAACVAAIRRVAQPGSQLVLLGAGDRTTQYATGTTGSLHGFGVDVGVALGSTSGTTTGPAALPLSLTVGAWLVQQALDDAPDATIGWSIGDAGGPVELPDAPVALLVMGDGSARRSTSAPGYLDPRAAGFDAAVARALAAGNPDGLRVDPELGDELLAAGSRTWQAAAVLLSHRRWRAELLYDAAPYGVGYFVATWLPA
jgi:hypothetical protein